MNESGIISWEICQLVRFGLFSDEQAVAGVVSISASDRSFMPILPEKSVWVRLLK